MDPDGHDRTRPHGGGHSHQKHSNSDLLSSAKLVAGAAQSTFRHDSQNVDKAKVAHAAGDLLEAACQYGKLEDKSFGKYLDKAEDYLHNYGGGAGSAATAHGGAGGGHSGSHSAKPDQTHSHSDQGHSGGGGGYGDYMKLAQGFMKSDSGSDSKTESHGHGHGHGHSSGGDGGSGGGYGDYLKMAEGFLKK